MYSTGRTGFGMVSDIRSGNPHLNELACASLINSGCYLI